MLSTDLHNVTLYFTRFVDLIAGLGHLSCRMHLINIFIIISPVCLSNMNMYCGDILFAFK